ncbi:hypothetical protein BJY01DRAFT_218054 [Aspergillus pseudoustus]|uniref:Nephrocystin 3-like N-terminal domain-containing protein n=1 Tax=Aspergillus pseudoustus TaxID=1810923 RepID=A0ABR4JLF7_9EURO
MIMTSLIVNDLHTLSESDKTGIAYIYCSFRHLGANMSENILSSLLKQLTQQLPQLLDFARLVLSSFGLRHGREIPYMLLLHRTLLSTSPSIWRSTSAEGRIFWTNSFSYAFVTIATRLGRGARPSSSRPPAP